ncbi:type II secretion system protein N [Sphingomonas sp. Leaf339]|uniref:type II secretion system protein N n=1 Tax=Sphingomonas sp. Leaf339 TaxID=1736343 RepID=UPI000A9874F0|nr:type II secretion system protein N [Sphingomonas sp. Leaf339]
MTTPVRPHATIRPELLPARSAQRSLYALGIIALLLIGTVAFWHWSPVEPVASAGTGVVVVAGDTPAATDPSAGVGIELRAVFVGGTPAASSATIGRDGQQPATFRIGDTVAPGITLAAVESDHVVLIENGVRSDLYLLGGVGAGPAPARQGLDPAPVRPSGELSAEEIVARTNAGGAEPVRKTPEEEAAGR